jgi:O-antigen ligase
MLMMVMVWRRFGWKIGIAIGVVMFVGIFVFGPSRMDTISTEEDSASARIDSWSVGIDLLRTHPLFGVGAHMFTEYHPKTAHNSWILCASELGLFGYVPWILMIYISIKNLYYISKNAVKEKHGELGRYADGIMLGLIAFMLAATFLSRTYIEPFYILIGLSAAITTVFIQRDGNKFELMSRRDVGIGVALAVGTMVFFKIFLLWAWS